MNPSAPEITRAEIEAILAQVAAGAVAPKTAHALLTLNGLEGEDAARRIFVALGGGDRIDLNAEGRAIYVGSGRLVAVVNAVVAGLNDTAAPGLGHGA